MLFQANLKNLKDCPAHVNWLGKKRFFWSKHSLSHWVFPNTGEAIFSTDSALLEDTLSIAEMLLEASECLSPHYEWAE
tara:strand:+ start:48 stop:281 length:234 start_codon:yes stop_codon:yes gene_type:complete